LSRFFSEIDILYFGKNHRTNCFKGISVYLFSCTSNIFFFPHSLDNQNFQNIRTRFSFFYITRKHDHPLPEQIKLSKYV